MMLANIAVVSVTFASVTMILAALGMFLRDLLVKPEPVTRQRLALAPVEPEGTIDRSFFRLVEESGTTLDMATWLAIVIGGGILGAGAPLVLFENLLAAAIGLVVGVAAPLYPCLPLVAASGMQQLLRPTSRSRFRSRRSNAGSSELVSREIKGPLGQEFGSLINVRTRHAPSA
jgi:hypothetical protein